MQKNSFNPFEELNERLSRIEQELIRQRTITASTEKLKHELPFLSAPAAAKKIGIALQTLYGLTCRKQIKHYKTGKKLYFKHIDILNYIESGHKKTREEIAAESRPTLVKKGAHKWD